MPIDVQRVASAGLSDEIVSAWRRLALGFPTWRSPFFDPDFTRAVASVRDDVGIAVVRDAGGISGVLPFMWDTESIGRPIGGAMCDFHGPVFDLAGSFPIDETMAACGLRRWSFTHLVDPADQFRRHTVRCGTSPYADLSEGFEPYRRALEQAGHQSLKQTWRAARVIERDIGPIEFREIDDDPESFERLAQWKSDQYRRT
ncbi:MAG: hypothetical protein FJ297_19330, partial [Planctomycetes bacterium]|nr:hypothetical protein [Planctomycetota bacterium]